MEPKEAIRDLSAILRIATIACFMSWPCSQAWGKTILEIQPQASTNTITIADQNNKPSETIRFINLNPSINVWYVIAVKWSADAAEEYYHIENPTPDALVVSVDPKYPVGIILQETGGKTTQCMLWAQKEGSPLVEVAKVERYYAPLCEGKLYLRQQGLGRETARELVADFLRRNIWGGEQITTFVKQTFYQDKFLIKSALSNSGAASTSGFATPDAPLGADLEPQFQKKYLAPEHLAIDIGDYNGKPLEIGVWYPAKKHDGVFVSVAEAKLISKDILASHPKRVKPLDAVEEDAVNYLVGFDLTKFRMGFALGTKHPSLEWSERSRPEIRDKTMPGPDGIADAEPLVLTGSINPLDKEKIVATFTAGFKRSHAAFKWGKLSEVNYGSHYGFVENGVVFSKLQPGLATLLIYQDGRVDMKTWQEKDNAELGLIRHARQNGVPIIEKDLETGAIVPHSFVGSWHLGNWSGSVDSKQRALRAGACIQTRDGRDFLIYGYFSSGTPNAMARVFQSYNCRYAMHLDMNALEHTYLALYGSSGNSFRIEHLISGMKVLDREFKGQIIPRFLGAPDNRDFFYLVKKDTVGSAKDEGQEAVKKTHVP